MNVPGGCWKLDDSPIYTRGHCWKRVTLNWSLDLQLVQSQWPDIMTRIQQHHSDNFQVLYTSTYCILSLMSQCDEEEEVHRDVRHSGVCCASHNVFLKLWLLLVGIAFVGKSNLSTSTGHFNFSRCHHKTVCWWFLVRQFFYSVARRMILQWAQKAKLMLPKCRLMDRFYTHAHTHKTVSQMKYCSCGWVKEDQWTDKVPHNPMAFHLITRLCWQGLLSNILNNMTWIMCCWITAIFWSTHKTLAKYSLLCLTHQWPVLSLTCKDHNIIVQLRITILSPFNNPGLCRHILQNGNKSFNCFIVLFQLVRCRLLYNQCAETSPNLTVIVFVTHDTYDYCKVFRFPKWGVGPPWGTFLQEKYSIEKVSETFHMFQFYSYSFLGNTCIFYFFFFFYCATADLFTVAPTLQDFGRMTATWCHCMQDVCDLTSGRILLHMLARFLQGSHATSLLQGRDECSRAVKRRWEKTEWIQRLCFLKVAAWKISEWTAAKHESMYVNLENIQKTLSCVTNYCHCYCN